MVEIDISDMTSVFGWRPYLRNIDYATHDLNNLHQEVLSMQMCSPGSSNYYQNTAPKCALEHGILVIIDRTWMNDECSAHDMGKND